MERRLNWPVTRLALQAAGASAEGYPNGVFWVPLATLRGDELVLETAASALGTDDGLTAHITDKRLLLLFDNFEHVLGAARGVAAIHREVVERARAVGSRHIEADSLGAFGEHAVTSGHLEEGLPLLKESTRIFLDIGSREYGSTPVAPALSLFRAG
jgi:predicted ATPase